MIPNYDKLALGHTLAEVNNGMPNGIFTDCEAYGMVGGRDEYCPVLIAGRCGGGLVYNCPEANEETQL